VTAFDTYVVEDRFDRAIKVIRNELFGAHLDVVGELDIEDVLGPNKSNRPPCMILLVDNPLRVFEALALDRAAAVFLPLHVMVVGISDGRTQVSILDPTRLFDGRFPPGAAGPIGRLVARAELALQVASERRHGTEAPMPGER
jgi:uncharacterized protein (DUF302 family)